MYALVLVELAPAVKLKVIDVVVALELTFVGGDGATRAVPVVCAVPLL
jgi:hypothetical protein